MLSNERHDAWKDNYDAWKLASPDDEHPYEECFHEHYEINWEGRATCDSCGEAWWPTAIEIAAFREQEKAFDAYMRREERLDRYWRPLWRLWFRFLAWVWPRKPKPIDDGLPF